MYYLFFFKKNGSSPKNQITRKMPTPNLIHTPPRNLLLHPSTKSKSNIKFIE